MQARIEYFGISVLFQSIQQSRNGRWAHQNTSRSKTSDLLQNATSGE